MEAINPRLAKSLSWGQKQLDYFTRCPHILAASEYNRRELLSRGYQQVDVLPYFIQFASLDEKIRSEKGQSILTQYNDDRTNWLFVGRIVPNKCQDDLIRIFAYYQRHIDSTARLLLVGPFSDTPGYYEQLKHLARMLELTNVKFCGLALGDVLNAYYRVADGYISMSEHEGFGIPLIEAMYLDLPVIAYAAAAVPDTLGQAGILIHNKRFEVIAELLQLVSTNDGLRAKLLSRQRERVAKLVPKSVTQRLWEIVQKWQ
jgi:glycosyltransferase involved in cell wall biosynthesis